MGLVPNGRDMPVPVPADVPPGGLRVVGTGTGSLPGTRRPRWWEVIDVAPVGDDGVPPPWVVRTVARRGCRPGGDGGWTVDGGLPAVAATAVEDLSGEAGGLVAARLDDERTWARTTLDVDGYAFVLRVYRRPEGVVAVADLGPVLVAVSGRTPPPGAWAARLLDPAAARAATDGG